MNYSEVSAAEAFEFCTSRNWDADAWIFWYAWRDTTWLPRARPLLGLPDIQETDRKFCLSDDTVARFCETRGWGDTQRQNFYAKLWQTIF